MTGRAFGSPWRNHVSTERTLEHSAVTELVPASRACDFSGVDPEPAEWASEQIPRIRSHCYTAAPNIVYLEKKRFRYIKHVQRQLAGSGLYSESDLSSSANVHGRRHPPFTYTHVHDSRASSSMS